MARRNHETKKEWLAREVARAVSAGKAWDCETVDFADPGRPPTCLEVDFPILPINQIAAIEGNAGKPIYQMSKWWARRRSSVFRAMLIAGATKAPEDPSEAAKLVWDAYYGNHQKKGAFKHLKVADIFMGGGTTVKVVFELFQDLDRFSLDDYKPFSDIEESKNRLSNFLKVALEQQGGGIRPLEGGRFSIVTGNGIPERVGTMDRELARADDTVDLIGIDYPLVSDLLNRWSTLSPESIGTAVSDGREKPCSLSIWLVREHVRESEQRTHLVPLAVDSTGQRVPLIEKRHTALFHRPPASSVLSMEERRHLLKSVIEPMLQRELQHRGIASETGRYSVELVGWVEVS